MKILIDTNVILDVFLHRIPHYEHSSSTLKLCSGRVSGHFAVSQSSDIFYLLRKNGLTLNKAKASLAILSSHLQLLDTISSDVENALKSDMEDFEDALLAFCAKRHGIQYIITRDKRDFSLSPVKTISPQDFIEHYQRN